MEFHPDMYKAEIIQIQNAEKGIKAKIKWNREQIQFYRKKRNCGKEITELKQNIKGLQWFSYINSFVLELLESKLKEILKEDDAHTQS